MTPKRFMRIINHTCEASPQHIVLPEGTEARILRAAAEVTRKGLAHITLLGEPAAVQAEARRIAVDISAVSVPIAAVSKFSTGYTSPLFEVWSVSRPPGNIAEARHSRPAPSSSARLRQFLFAVQHCGPSAL